MMTYELSPMEFLRLKNTPNRLIDHKIAFNKYETRGISRYRIRIFDSREKLVETVNKRISPLDSSPWQALIPLTKSEINGENRPDSPK